jgi:dipeptidase D
MAGAIDGLKPPLFWKYFAEISRIPRGSKNERAISNYIVATARKLGLEFQQDQALNVVVRKPASPGHERAGGVCLQSHLDMVCEKLPAKQHDFLKDPITLVRRGDVLTADGTTLGADNGAGVASCLAAMEDKSLVHGPLELLFTVDEETGLTGANNLQPGFVKSRVLLNLDSEEEGELYIGCSGGMDTVGVWKLERDEPPANSVGLEVKVAGLRGGHSGLEIDKGRANAIKIANRVVMKLAESGGRLARFDGGSKRNAIPSYATVLVCVPKAKLAEATAAVAAMHETLRTEFAIGEPDLQIAATQPKGRAKVFKKSLQKKLSQVIAGLPHGVIKMSAEISWLVETSTNVAVIATGRSGVTLMTSQRSSVASEILEIAYGVQAVMELGGGMVSHSDGYPGWKPNLGSPILKTAKQVYKDLYGKVPEAKACHAGLECGIIGDKYPGMDMVSLGPTMAAVHSPEERIYVETVPKYWDYLAAILKKLS